VTLGLVGFAYVVGLCYLALHFLMYVVILRENPFFQTEQGIFAYHFISAFLFAVIALAACWINPDIVVLATAFGLAATHCIYSISFLELWSVAQGSYSISIITGMESGVTYSREKLVTNFFQIGNAKKANRIVALARLSLIHRVGDRWQLTCCGRLLTVSLVAVLWLSNPKKIG
jgi:hypothetical protein